VAGPDTPDRHPGAGLGLAPGCGPAAGRCARGGLAKVIAVPDRVMEEHLKSCSSGKDENAARAARDASTPVLR
jgi:hypothetical protein